MRSAEKRQQPQHPLGTRASTGDQRVRRNNACARALGIIITSVVENDVGWVQSLASPCLDLTKARQAVSKQRDGTSPILVVWDTRAWGAEGRGVGVEATESSGHGAAAW